MALFSTPLAQYLESLGHYVIESFDAAGQANPKFEYRNPK